ncbi:MAG: PEP-CTERM sorting domain-containing protein [Candidatus Brocadiae bacterium]|nr:PEP-CTERM sorting domain-containing protein [Candidatus Brocadiia bacterium]
MTTKYLFIATLVILFVFSANATIISGYVINSGNGQYVYTGLVGAGSSTQATGTVGQVSVLVGTLNLLAGQQIRITKIGIGGDSKVDSGDNRFRLVGSGLDFTWVSGQQAVAATYRLAGTPYTGQQSRFTFYNVDITSNTGGSLSLYWDYHYDYDSVYLVDTDPLGNAFNDSAYLSSIRPWIQFEYVNVPEPSSMILMGFAFLGMMIFAKKSKK